MQKHETDVHEFDSLLEQSKVRNLRDQRKTKLDKSRKLTKKHAKYSKSVSMLAPSIDCQ